VSFEVVRATKTLFLVFASQNVTEEMLLFLVMDLPVPTHILLGDKALPAVFTDVRWILMPAIVMVELVALFERLMTLIAGKYGCL
jgi:hypothetical protein